MKNLDHILDLCKRENSKAQKELYDFYSPILFGICRRYIKNYQDAEDVLIEGFYKIFSKLKQYNGKGSFEGWMKRIVVNESLMFLRKRNVFKFSIEVDNLNLAERAVAEHRLMYKDLMDVLATLPTGYRTIFNLYEIEGYKHREIAELLGISINTSKSQLILAKNKLRGLLKKKTNSKVG